MCSQDGNGHLPRKSLLEDPHCAGRVRDLSPLETTPLHARETPLHQVDRGSFLSLKALQLQPPVRRVTSDKDLYIHLRIHLPLHCIRLRHQLHPHIYEYPEIRRHEIHIHPLIRGQGSIIPTIHGYPIHIHQYPIH